MIDRHSETWREIATWAHKRLSEAVAHIETLGVEPAETENLRGQIAELRALLALTDAPEPKPTASVDDYGHGFQGV